MPFLLICRGVGHFANSGRARMTRRGNPRLHEVRPRDTTRANLARTALADDHARATLAALEFAYYECGVNQNGERAAWLNANGYRTRRGNLWSKKAVERLIKRIVRPGFKLA
jgi:hypothetical protein